MLNDAFRTVSNAVVNIFTGPNGWIAIGVVVVIAIALIRIMMRKD